MTLLPDQLSALKAELIKVCQEQNEMITPTFIIMEAVANAVDILNTTGRLLPENITNEMMKAGLDKARPILNLPDTVIEAALYHAFNAMIAAAKGE